MIRVGAVVLALLYCGLSQATNLSPRALDQIPLHVVPSLTLERAQSAMPETRNDGVIQLAVPVEMALSLDDGVWASEGDQMVWRLRVYSTGATLMMVGLDTFELPDSASFWISDINGGTRHGPLTSSQRAADGSFWSPMVPGEEALLELRVAAAEKGKADLRVTAVGHGVLPLSAGQVQAKAAGACNIDAACETDAGWQDQVRSVVLVQVGTTGCSGAMVNSTANDNRPYILTANHCGIRSANAGNMTAYFNYQRSFCGGANDANLGQAVTGATHRFSQALSDHTLVELNSAPPLSYGVYFAGFDADASALPQSGRGIHHPAADRKSISTYNTAATKERINLQGVTVDAFRVVWSAGVTEQGSSGSGLWNQNRKIVGVLSGGASTCGGGLLGLDPPSQGPDFYGRLEIAWSAGISAFLDPGSSGLRNSTGRNQTAGGGTPTPTPAPTPTPTPPAPTPTTAPGGGGGGGALGGGLVLAMLLAGWLRRARRTG